MLVRPVPQARAVIAERSTFESAGDLGKLLAALGYLLVSGNELLLSAVTSGNYRRSIAFEAAAEGADCGVAPATVGSFDRDRDLRCGRMRPMRWIGGRGATASCSGRTGFPRAVRTGRRRLRGFRGAFRGRRAARSRSMVIDASLPWAGSTNCVESPRSMPMDLRYGLGGKSILAVNCSQP